MPAASPRFQQARFCLLLFTFFVAVYMLTFRAVIQSGDTRRAFDAVSSLTRYGDWLMDESAWTKPAQRIRASDALPLLEYDVEERLNTLLATPLLKLADFLPRLGNIHAVWLFNVLVSALCLGLLYLLLRALHYSAGVALVVALTAGLGSNLWAYSQTFFREPLVTCFILLTLLLLQSGRRRRRILCLALSAVSLFLASQTKYSAVMALPALVIFALPETRPQLQKKVYGALLSLALLTIAFFMLIDPLPAPLAALLDRFGWQSAVTGAALRVYLLSPGGSLWGTSPSALLALACAVLLWRRGQYRLVTTIVLLVAGYSLGHALTTGVHWFGGLSWPPRFLLPALPVLLLASAPLAERMLEKKQRLLRLLWLGLLLYGIWIQFSAVSLSWRHYDASLPAAADGLGEWLPGLTQPQYFRWTLLPQRWLDLGLDFLWARAGLPIWLVSFALLAGGSAALLLRLLRAPGSRWRHAVPPLAFFCLPLILLNLNLAYDKDPRSRSQQSALHAALAQLENEAQDDLLLLAGNDYGEFILNHLDSAAVRPIILPQPLAQAASDKQPAKVVSNNPNDWFDVGSHRIIQHLAGGRDRLWQLAHTSQFMPWSFRPLERYLALNYYPLREIDFSQADETVRLLEYSTRPPAPNPLSPYSGDIASDLTYGPHIQLRALTPPNGTRYRPGESVEVSLLWQTAAPLEHDYTVALFIAAAGAQQHTAQGQDSQPQAGFAPTSGWQPGLPVWDNRALRLPATTAPGDYRLWLVLYRYDASSGATQPLRVSGAEVSENGTVGILPVTLTID